MGLHVLVPVRLLWKKKESKQFRAFEDPIASVTKPGTMETVEIVVTLDHCER